MKILKYFFGFSLTILFVLQSCKLDEILRDTPTMDNLQTEADVTAVIRGMYAQLNDPSGFKFLGHIMLTVMADDIYSTAGSEYGPYQDRSLTSTNTSPFWNRLYSTIGNANSLIGTVDKLTFLSAASKKRALGEAYFIRAFSYYYLVRLYGGVPLNIEATSATSNFYKPRNTVDEVYAQIFKDLKAASSSLPMQGQIAASELGRASKGAAQALLAQAYLTFGNQLSLKGQSPGVNYQNAILYADSVINSAQYALLNDYGDLFDISKEDGAYKEVIFGVRFQTDASARAQPAAGSEFALRFAAGNTWGVTAGGAAGGNTYRVAHWFADYYRKGDYSNGLSTFTPDIDYRNEKAFFQRGVNNLGRFFAVYPNIPGSTIPGSTADGTINDPLISKYIDAGGKDSRNHGNDFFIIRFAEIYLIKAEAENEINGNTAVARAAFNMVRARARRASGTARLIPADITSTTLTKDQLRLKIFDERGLELVGEGQRWFDLVRMRSPLSATQTMYEYQFKVILNNTANFPRTLPTGFNTTTRRFTPTAANAVYAPIVNVTVPKFLLFPVPASEINQNLNFGPQNTGW